MSKRLTLICLFAAASVSLAADAKPKPGTYLTEAEARAIVAQAKEEAEMIATEGKRRLDEFMARSVKQVEQKIAQAEARATKDVRDAAVEVALAATRKLIAASVAAEMCAGLAEAGLSERDPALAGNRFNGQPLVEASIRITLGRTYRVLGEYGPARTHLDRALDLRQPVWPQQSGKRCVELVDGTDPARGEDALHDLTDVGSYIQNEIFAILGGTVSTYVGNYMTTFAITTLKLPGTIAMTATVIAMPPPYADASTMPACSPPGCSAQDFACVRQQYTASSKSPTMANDRAVSRTGTQSSSQRSSTAALVITSAAAWLAGPERLMCCR